MSNPEMLEFVSAADTQPLRELARSCRRFAQEELSVDPKEPPKFSRQAFERMGKIGLTGASIPESAGGTELSRTEVAAIAFELSRVQLGPAIYLSVHQMISGLIAKWGGAHFTPLLQELAAGKKLGAFCLTEAQAGSDASALRTRAVRKGEEYILNGEKVFITSSGSADTYLVFARTGEDPKQGISAFAVGKNAPGISFGTPERKMGCEGSPIGSVAFVDCRVPASQRLAEEGDGYRIALSGLAGGRVNIAASGCGLSSRAIELAVGHLRERQQFGHPLAEFQGLQFMIADLFQRLRASVLLTRDAAAQLDQGAKCVIESAVAKCFATDSAMQITTDAVQLFGGAGYLTEYEVERLMRDAKMLQIVEGTNQIQRVVIARELLR